MVIRLEEGGRLIPVYPLTAGLSLRMIGANVACPCAVRGAFPRPYPRGDQPAQRPFLPSGYAMENIHPLA